MASWNDQLSACQSRLLTLSPYPRLRPHDSDPVLTDTQPWPEAAPYPDARPLTPPPSEVLDRELQEAFQECEEQMASLGMLNSTEPLSITPEMVNDIRQKTGEAMVNKSTESSSLPPVVVQPEHSSGGHGNKSTHGNSEAAHSQKDTVVFSFRNYILGTESSARAPEMETEIKVNQNLDKCPEVKPEIDKQKETPLHTQLETTDSFKETQTDVPFTDQRDNLRQEHFDSNAATEENGTLVCNTVIREEGTQAITEIIDAKEENYSGEASINICIAETGKKGDSVHGTQECSNLHLKDADALSETQTGANNHTEEEQVSKTDVWRTSLSDKEAEPDKKAKKKEKKKNRKKKKVEKNTEREESTIVQPESDLQAVSLIDTGNHTDSVANIQSVSQADSHTVICGEQPDDGFDYKQQLSPGGKPSFSPPLSSSPSRQDHLTYSACSPASSQALSQRPHQSDNHSRTDAPCSMNHCSEESPQQEQHVAAAIMNSQNTPMTHVQSTVICPSASADKMSDAQTQEAIVTSGAVILAQENQSPLSNSQICVGEVGVESALEEALVLVAALPLTTPTMPEVIESKGEGESVRRDSLERVATVAIAESEKAEGEKDLGGIDKCLSYADRGKEGLLDSLPPLSLIRSQGKCTLAFSATEGQAASEESCSSKMPHNSVETEMKGPRETSVCSSDTEVSSAEEGAREKEPQRLEAFIDTSPHGLLTGPDCQDHRAVGLDGAGEGGVAEEIEKKGGLTGEHSSFSQPEGSASGVSSAETKTCPPTDVAESPLKPQCWSELIPTITESLCTEKDRLSQPCQEQHAAAPLPTHPEQSSGNTNGGVRADLKLNLISEEALSLGHICEESSITETEKNYSQVFLSLISPQPPTTSQQIPVDRQASNNQQVQPESSTVEARTAEGASEFQAQTQINRGRPAMSGVGLHVCKSGGRNNKVHFAGTVKQEGSSFVNLRNMAVLAMDCASLPPLTVHESLHHPVVEASYTFPDFLSSKKPEIPTNAAPTKDEPAIRSSADLTKPQKDVQLDKGDTGSKDANENLNIDQSGNKNVATNAVGLQLVTEACSKQLQCPNEKNQNANEECFVLSQSAIFEADHLTIEQVSAKVTKQLEAETEKGTVNLCSSKEKEIDKLHAESEQPLESPLVSDATVILEENEAIQHPLSSCSVLPVDDVACKHLNDVVTEIPNGQFSTDLDPSSKPQTVTLTCTASLQTKPSDPSCQPPTQLDETPLCGLAATDPTKATLDSADLTKDESISEVAASDQWIPVIEQCTSNPTFVLQTPGPMLSHLEFITDSDISLPEQTDNHSADGGSTKVHGRNNREMTQMSLAQDMKHSDISVKADETCPEMENRNYAVESDIFIDNSVINNVDVQFSQEENLSPGAVGVLAKTGSDHVTSQTHTEPDSTGIKPVICESPTKDDLISVSCPLSSDLPTNEAYDEIKRDSVKEKHKIEDETYMLFEEEKKQVEETTMINQKETGGRLQTGKTGTTAQQSNGPDKEVVEEIGDLQPSHKHTGQITESPIRDKKKSDIASKSQRETCSLSPDRHIGVPEIMRSTEVEFGSEPQTVYYQGLCQTPTATLECSSDRDTAQSVALGQSQSTPDSNCFAQQQDQQQQCLGSRLPPEESSGGCLEGGEKTKSQVRQTQALVPGVNGVAEAVDCSVGTLCQSGSGDNLTGDDSRGNERVMGLEKGEGEGAQAARGVGRVYLLSHPASDSNESGTAAERTASAERGVVTASSHVGDKRQGMDENKRPGLWVVGSALDLMSDAEFLSDLGSKGQQKSNLSAACQDQHGTPGTSKNTAVSVKSASQERETSPFQISVTSEVSADGDDVLTEVFSSANQAEEIHREISSTLADPVRQPETVENDSSAAKAVKSNSSETEEGEIQHPVCEPLKLQSSNIPSATQSSPGAKAPIKGPGVEEITKEDKAALVQEKASSQGNGQHEIKAIKNEGMEKKEVVNPTGSAKDSGLGSMKVSDLCKSGVSHHSTETETVCYSEGNTGPSKVTENDSGITGKTTPDVITVPSVVSSKCMQDFASTPPAAPTQSEKPHDQALLSKPKDDIVVNPIVADSQFEGRSLQNAPACNSVVDHVSVNTDTADASESPAPGLISQEPNTSWIKALKEAASHSQSTQENTVDTSR